MKKILAVLLAFSLAVSLCACGLVDKIGQGVVNGIEQMTESAAQSLEEAGIGGVSFSGESYDMWAMTKETTEVTETDADGVTTSYTDIWEYGFDEFGNQTYSSYTQTAEDGSVSRSAHFSAYDQNGNQISYCYIDDAGYLNWTTYYYDENGNTIRVVESSSDGDSEYINEYDDAGNMVRSTYTSARGYCSEDSYKFDADGNMIENLWTSVDEEGTQSYSKCTYTYDSDGKTLASTYEATGDYSTETVYTYDAEGNIATETTTDNEGTSVTTYTYDSDGWQTGWEEIGSDGSVTRSISVYDDDGNFLRSEYASEEYTAVTENTYDENGNLITSRYTTNDDESSTTTYIYNDAGQVVTEEYQNADGYAQTTQYEYDENGNTVKTVSMEINEDGSRRISTTVSEYRLLTVRW